MTVNGGAAALATLRPVSVAGDTVTLRLAQATVMGDRVTVTYTAPQGADAMPVRDLAGNAAANLPAQSVANRNGAAAPPAPTALAATVGDGRVRLTWQAPALNGGSDIIGYRVSHAAGAAVPAGTSGTDVGLVFERLVTGLANGREHVFEVRTVNGAGPGTAAQVRAMPAAAACVRPNLAGRRTVWTGTLTPGAIEEGGEVTAWGFRDSSGQLVESSFDLGGQSYVIDAAYRFVAGANAGQFRFGLTAALDSVHETALQLHVCDASLAFSAATSRRCRPRLQLDAHVGRRLVAARNADAAADHGRQHGGDRRAGDRGHVPGRRCADRVHRHGDGHGHAAAGLGVCLAVAARGRRDGDPDQGRDRRDLHAGR